MMYFSTNRPKDQSQLNMSPTPVAWESALRMGERNGRDERERERERERSPHCSSWHRSSPAGQFTTQRCGSTQHLLQIEELLPAWSEGCGGSRNGLLFKGLCGDYYGFGYGKESWVIRESERSILCSLPSDLWGLRSQRKYADWI